MKCNPSILASFADRHRLTRTGVRGEQKCRPRPANRWIWSVPRRLAGLGPRLAGGGEVGGGGGHHEAGVWAQGVAVEAGGEAQVCALKAAGGVSGRYLDRFGWLLNAVS